MKIGVAGLGAMGAAIAARLIELGHEVTVWNRTPEKAKPLGEAGAKVVGSPAEVAAASEAVITILTDGKAIDDVYNGPNGLLSGDVKGKLFIEMSTVAPKVETALAPKVKAKGATMVECPVGGSTAPARKGQLLGLMGAEAADAARALPILEQLCRKVVPCGPIGAGAAMKLAINLPLMVAWQAYGEAFAIAPQRRLDAAAPARSVRREQRRQQRAQDARRHDRHHVRGQGSGADHLLDRQRREGSAHHGRDRRGAGRRHDRHQGGARRLRGRASATASAAATARK